MMIFAIKCKMRFIQGYICGYMSFKVVDWAIYLLRFSSRFGPLNHDKAIKEIQKEEMRSYTKYMMEGE